MTVIEKLSDRNGLIFQAIRLVLVNEGEMNLLQLQYKLFQVGIYISDAMLKQAMSVMKEKGLVGKPQSNGQESKEQKDTGTTEA